METKMTDRDLVLKTERRDPTLGILAAYDAMIAAEEAMDAHSRVCNSKSTMFSLFPRDHAFKAAYESARGRYVGILEAMTASSS